MHKQVVLSLGVPHDLSNDRICDLIRHLLDIGLSDAEETLEEYDSECEDSRDVLLIDFESVEVLG